MRLAELSGTLAAFQYNLKGLPTRQEPRMLSIDHPFDWHTFDLFVDMFQLPCRLLVWAIEDVCEFVRLCRFFKVHKNSLWHCLGISVPQECPWFFSQTTRATFYSAKSHAFTFGLRNGL